MQKGHQWLSKDRGGKEREEKIIKRHKETFRSDIFTDLGW